MQKIFLKALVQKLDSENGIIEAAIASDESTDRDGEQILATAWDFKNFNMNPVLLWAHDYRSEPIGKVLELKMEGNRLFFKPQFAVNITERAKQIFELYKQGFLNAFSVGFIPKEQEGNKFTKVELLEISAVPVPSNANALVQVRSAEGIDKSIIEEIEKSIVENKRAVPYKDLGKVENLESPWDGAKEVETVGNDTAKLKEISAWFDEENTDNKGAYKLPHHRASDMKAVWRGVSAAMAALLGARGGVEIPESDRKAVYDHLAKHYTQFEKNPPDFKLVEIQALKDVSFETEAPIIVQIVKVDNADIAKLQEDIEFIKQAQAGTTSAAPAVENKPGERSLVREIALDKNKTKRLLQAVANNVGAALHNLKQLPPNER